MRKKYLVLTILIFSVFLFISCNESPVGIFYGLKIEEKVLDYSLPNSLTSERMIKSSGYLYCAAGTIYRKPAGGAGGDWSRISSPDKYRKTTEIAVTSDGEIFCLSYNDRAKTMLFKRDGSSGKWIHVHTPSDGGLSKLRIANDIIFLSDKKGDLYHSSDRGASFVQDKGRPKLFESSKGVFDLVWDGDDYYLNAQYKLYRGGPDSWKDFSPSGSDKKAEDEIFTKFYYDEKGKRLYIADTEGYIYAVDSPSSAEASEWEWVKSNDNTPRGIGIQGMTLIEVGKHKVLLLGSGFTGGEGYYEVYDPSTYSGERLEPEIPRRSKEFISDYYDYMSFDLSKAPITDFFVDYYSDDPDEVNFDIYAMTNGYGLWKNSKKGTGRRGWNLE